MLTDDERRTTKDANPYQLSEPGDLKSLSPTLLPTVISIESSNIRKETFKFKRMLHVTFSLNCLIYPRHYINIFYKYILTPLTMLNRKSWKQNIYIRDRKKWNNLTMYVFLFLLWITFVQIQAIWIIMSQQKCLRMDSASEKSLFSNFLHNTFYTENALLLSNMQMIHLKQVDFKCTRFDIIHYYAFEHLSWCPNSNLHPIWIIPYIFDWKLYISQI